MYDSMKVTAYPRTAVITDPFLPLDGILLFEAMRQQYGPQLLTTPGVTADIPLIDLPLEKRGGGGLWYYACSFAQWGPFADGSNYWNKRFDLRYEAAVDFDNRRGRVLVEAGRYKAYHMPVFYRHALSVSWYCVGDTTAVRGLLSNITHVGKKTSQGWGRIIKWEVKRVDYDWSVYGGDGELMRSVPAADGILYGFRPPYWLPENQAVCKHPIMGLRQND